MAYSGFNSRVRLVLSVFSVVFYKFNPNALSEMNQIWNVSRKSIDGAMLKI